MTEPTPAPNPEPAPAPNPAPQAAQRPEWLPEPHWDPEAGAIKDDFGAHYAEIAKFHQTETEARAALAARKPEDIKLEIKLPDTVKLPDGMKAEINEKDPRIPILREMAVKHGLPQGVVDELVALDIQDKIAAHTAEMERIAAEDKKLGANVKERKTAVTSWLSAFKDLKPEHRAEIDILTATAAGVEFVEMLIAKSSGSVPGTTENPPPKLEPKSHAERIWGAQAFQPNPQAKVS